MNEAAAWTLFALTGLVGYFLGSANTSLVIGKFYGIDVRKHGSGNAGATNTLRTLGKTAAALVGLGDVLKGVIAVLLGWWLGGLMGENAMIGGMAGGLGSVLGHNWPIYFGFKGGKGVFTSAAVIFMTDYRIGLILLAVFVILVAATRYISLGSVTVAVLLPIFFFIFYRQSPELIQALIFSLIIGALIVFRHMANIKRLLNGTESKLGSKVKVDAK